MSEKLLLSHGVAEENVAAIKEILGVRDLELNEMQEDFLGKGLLVKDRVVVLSPAASGKTLLVYLKYAKELQAGRKTMIYLVPYTRIQTEKIHKFKRWEKQGVIVTDDYPAYESGKAQILVATYAAMDAWLLRGRKPEANLFVFDEIDMITDDLQGARVESAVSRLMRESHVDKVYALSATIGSPELVERWLKCVTFRSEFRPGDFSRRVLTFPEGKEDHEILEEIFESDLNAKYPMLVFFYNTRYCRDKARELSECRKSSGMKVHEDIELANEEIGKRCDMTSEVSTQMKCLEQRVAFYYAKLQPLCKSKIEELFEKRLLDVVFTTPALA